MATEKRRPKFAEVEYERAHAAYEEHRKTGKTELTCLRCGVGHFQFFETGSSLEIRCTTADCFVENIRGI